jgi:hypothetical protein
MENSMRIIVLQGLPNRGKTTTLNSVWNLLCPNGQNSTNRQPLGGDRNDFTDIVIRGEQRIGFYTAGDNSTLLARAIMDHGSNQLCDVFVCGLR